MHRCLTVVEIVQIICSNLDPTRFVDERRALAALARTCCTFQEPALDRLWSTQTTLGPFLKCMPPDLFDFESRIWRLLRPIVAMDWRRALCYSSRVKIFTFNFIAHERFSEVLAALNLCLPGRFLFPNLQNLHWNRQRSAPDLAPTPIFLPPTLQSISFNCLPNNANLSLLSTLAGACPRLTRVFVTWRPTSDRANGVTSLFILALSSLQAVAMDMPSIAALDHLRRLPALTSLDLSGIPSGIDGLDASFPVFPRLRTLHLRWVAIERATTFFLMCSNIPLASLDLTFSNCARITATVDFYHALRASCSHTSLTSLTLANHGHIALVGQDNFAITGLSLRILSCFRNMESLSITSSHGFDLDDATFVEVVQAWPRIANLTLDTFGEGPIRTTLASLYSLAEYCPLLRSLHIHFDATSIPAPRAHLVQQRLTSLAVSSSVISASGPVARFLSGIFPSLVEITTAREEEDNESAEELEDNGDEIAVHQRWKEVEALIPEFVVAREEGRSWAQS
ncbi:hypothetical protein C8R44DRAFT_981996 [Mycena epipterygia]|nr:hypothetical protein C8R44DRAFT_981996 [Mycena epipterygia]